MRNRSVSITGATGFLGWHIALSFLESGWHVRGIVRPGSAKAVPDGVDRVEAALTAPALARALAGCEAVVHSAGLTRSAAESSFATVNVEGTRAVADAAGCAGARLLLISSQAAAGAGTPEHPAREDDTARPLTAYGRSKLAAEEAVRSTARTAWTILRPCAVYGPRDRQFLTLLRLAVRGIFLLVAEPGTAFTLIYADDLARAVRMATEDSRAEGQCFFVGSVPPHTADEVLRSVAGACGRPYRPIRVPRLALRTLALAGAAAWRLGHVPPIDPSRLVELSAPGFVCAVDRARDVIGFTASTPLGEGLERTVRWYRAEGWL
jgi:nucleoside-diphosphate-sugar epimerase